MPVTVEEQTGITAITDMIAIVTKMIVVLGATGTAAHDTTTVNIRAGISIGTISTTRTMTIDKCRHP
jgi:hypothetical protein